MSPKILSLTPNSKNQSKLLSPTLLSFQREGFFSIPDLLNVCLNLSYLNFFYVFLLITEWNL